MLFAATSFEAFDEPEEDDPIKIPFPPTPRPTMSSNFDLDEVGPKMSTGSLDQGVQKLEPFLFKLDREAKRVYVRTRSELYSPHYRLFIELIQLILIYILDSK